MKNLAIALLVAALSIPAFAQEKEQTDAPKPPAKCCEACVCQEGCKCKFRDGKRKHRGEKHRVHKRDGSKKGERGQRREKEGEPKGRIAPITTAEAL